MYDASCKLKCWGKENWIEHRRQVAAKHNKGESDQIRMARIVCQFQNMSTLDRLATAFGFFFFLVRHLFRSLVLLLLFDLEKQRPVDTR